LPHSINFEYFFTERNQSAHSSTNISHYTLLEDIPTQDFVGWALPASYNSSIIIEFLQPKNSIIQQLE
jgi:hypothetical protein